MSKVLLLNDTWSWYHWGCTGTSSAIRKNISGMGFELSTLPINHTYAFHGHPGCLADLTGEDFFRRSCRDNAEVFDAIRDCSILVVNGEGTIHGSSEATLAVLYMAFAASIHLKKNVQIINHSCFPQRSMVLTDPGLCTLYRTVYQHMDFVAFREHLSSRLMRGLGVESTLAFDCLPLTIRDEYRGGAKRLRNRLLVAGSVAFDAVRIDDLIVYMRAMQEKGFEVQILTGARAYPAVDDQRFINMLQQASEGEFPVVSAGSLNEWLDAIASAGLFVSGRFHHTIAAMMLGTPFVLFDSNTPKNEALAETVGLDAPLQYQAESFADDLMEAGMRALETPGIASSRLDSLRERAELNFDGLRALL